MQTVTTVAYTTGLKESSEETCSPEIPPTVWGTRPVIPMGDKTLMRLHPKGD